MSKVVVNTWDKKSKINKNIYGHFSEHLGRCIYNGVFVGEDSKIPNTRGMRNDIVEAFRRIKLPVLRWPGGCFADEYHWKDGIGSKENRKKMVNTHWGGVVEDNSFGTHEFFELCEQIGCEPYINGNVGSGTVQEMSEWVEYMTLDGVSPMADLRVANSKQKPWDLTYFGVGNENWGCGGNMRPEHYADLYRRFQTYVRNYGKNKIYKIACGPSGADYNWTKQFMKIAGKYCDAITLHHYTVLGEWDKKGAATGFDIDDYYKTLDKTMVMEELIVRHTAIMDFYDPEHKVDLIVDEWGTWFDVEPGTNPGFLFQQNTMRDALVAAINLNIFNEHSDRVSMANIAQLVNVLQALILTEDEKMLLTPTYHVFDLYQKHQDATLVGTTVTTSTIGTKEHTLPHIHASSSVDEKGDVLITLANLSADHAEPVALTLLGKEVKNVKARILAGAMDDHNTFADSQKVTVEKFSGVTVTDSGISITMPACSVLELVVE